MSLRFYISPVIGTGTTPDDAIRPAAHDILRGAAAASYCVSPDKNWCLVAADADATVHGRVSAITGVTELPAPAADLDALPAAQRGLLTAALAKVGHAINPGDRGRDLIHRVGLSHVPGFDLRYNIPNAETNVAVI